MYQYQLYNNCNLQFPSQYVKRIMINAYLKWLIGPLQLYTMMSSLRESKLEHFVKLWHFKYHLKISYRPTPLTT